VFFYFSSVISFISLLSFNTVLFPFISHTVYEIIAKDSVVIEANNDSHFLNDIPDSSGFDFKIPDSTKKKQQEMACITKRSDGVCLSKEACHKRAGTIGNLCKQEKGLHCCTCMYQIIIVRLELLVIHVG